MVDVGDVPREPAGAGTLSRVCWRSGVICPDQVSGNGAFSERDLQLKLFCPTFSGCVTPVPYVTSLGTEGTAVTLQLFTSNDSLVGPPALTNTLFSQHC